MVQNQDVAVVFGCCFFYNQIPTPGRDPWVIWPPGRHKRPICSLVESGDVMETLLSGNDHPIGIHMGTGIGIPTWPT